MGATLEIGPVLAIESLLYAIRGAVGIPINGAIGDAIGLQRSLLTHVGLVMVTIMLAWYLPGEAEIERHAAGILSPGRPEAAG